MRIIHFKIREFKNLKEVEFSFENPKGLAIFVGCNGCGKSNLLEALSYIFEDINSPERFAEEMFEYELEYLDSHGSRCCAKHVKGESSRVVKRFHDNAPILESLSAVAVYNGDYNRLLSEGLSAVDFVTANDFNAALVAYLISDKHVFELSDGLICRANVNRVTYDFDNMLIPELDLESDDESECLMLELTDEGWRGNDGLMQIPFEEFVGVLDRFAHESDEKRSGLVRDLFDRFGDRIRGFTCEFKDAEVSYSSESLSEGEKKSILLNYALQLARNPNTVLMLDEPDASVHESRKIELLDALKAYSKESGVVLMTTHSPAIINECDATDLFALTRNGVGSLVSSGDKIDAESELLGDRLSWFANRPILFFEGKSDVQYVRKAIECFKAQSDFGDLEIEHRLEFRILGGTGEADFIVDELAKINGSRKLYVCLDNDSAGHDALRGLVEKGFCEVKTPLDASESTSNRLVFLLPPKGSSRVKMIEDYFSHDVYRRILEKEYNPLNEASMSEFKEKVSGLKKYVAKYALSKPNSHEPPLVVQEDFSGFKPLIDLVKALAER